MKRKRLIAMGIDLATIVLFEMIFYSLFGSLFPNEYVATAVAYFVALTLLALVQSKWEGKTIGKTLVGVKVVTDGNEPLTFSKCWLRFLLLYTFTLVSAGLIIIFNVVCILIRKDHKAIHDLIVHTHVESA